MTRTVLVGLSALCEYIIIKTYTRSKLRPAAALT